MELFRVFEKHKFDRNKKVANDSLVKTFHILIPDATVTYTSIEIQEAIIAFLNRTENLRKQILSLEKKTEKLHEAVMSRIFLLNDPFIINKFNKWSKDNNYDIQANDIILKKKKLEEIADFPRMEMALGKPDLTIEEYLMETKKNKKNYIPLIGGTLENNQVSGYFHKQNIRPGAITQSNIISWTRINGRHFFIQKEPVCTNDDSYIMKVNVKNSTEYVQTSLTVFMRNNNADWGNKIGKRKMMGVEIMIPEPVKAFSSIDIQNILSEFVGIFYTLKGKTSIYTSSIIEHSKKIDKAFLQQLFKDLNDN